MPQHTYFPARRATGLLLWAENTAAGLIWATMAAATLSYPAIIIYWAGNGS